MVMPATPAGTTLRDPITFRLNNSSKLIYRVLRLLSHGRSLGGVPVGADRDISDYALDELDTTHMMSFV